IEGAGNYFLGSKSLTVGSNNLSTEVSGVIQDGGDSGGTGGSLVKVGTGTLVLSGANTYSGGTTINGGTVALSADANLGSAAGGLTFNGGTLQLLGLTRLVLSPTRSITLNSGGGTFEVAEVTAVLAISQSLGGDGGLTKSGLGTLTLRGSNS